MGEGLWEAVDGPCFTDAIHLDRLGRAAHIADDTQVAGGGLDQDAAAGGRIIFAGHDGIRHGDRRPEEVHRPGQREHPEAAQLCIVAHGSA